MYYVVKLKYEVLDNKTGRLRKVVEEYLVDACGVTQAEELVINRLKNSIADFSIIGVQESKIMGIIK